MTSERGLQRMRQIAREEVTAVRKRDTEALCRLTELLPHSMEALRKSGLPATPEAETIVEEIRQAQEQAERYLQEQMRAVSILLQQCATARRARKAYLKGAAARQVDSTL